MNNVAQTVKRKSLSKLSDTFSFSRGKATLTGASSRALSLYSIKQKQQQQQNYNSSENLEVLLGCTDTAPLVVCDRYWWQQMISDVNASDNKHRIVMFLTALGDRDSENKHWIVMLSLTALGDRDSDKQWIVMLSLTAVGDRNSETVTANTERRDDVSDSTC